MKVPYKKCKNEHEAFKKAQNVVTKEYLGRWNVDAEVKISKHNGTISAKGKGFDLSINFFSQHCEAKLDLAFLLRPFQKKFEGIIVGELEKHL
jgi:hypothetical protein